MELEDIIQELDRRFDLPLREYYERRIIFWQDPEGEFREEIAGVKLQNAKVLVLTGRNAFLAKKLLAHDDITSNYLVYVPFAYERQEDNWLLDLELASESFRADLVSMWMREMEMPDEMQYRKLFKKYRKFFNAAARREKFTAMMGHRYSPAQVMLAMMAVLTKSRSTDPGDILRAVFEDGYDLETNEAYQRLVAYDLRAVFWSMVRQATGYDEQKDSSLERLLLHIFVTAASRVLPERAFREIAELRGQGFETYCFDFVSEWMHGVRRREFRPVAERVERSLNLVHRLQDLSLSELGSFDFFPCIDAIILAKLLQDAIDNLLDPDALTKVVERRRTTFWYEEHEDLYDALVEAGHMTDFLRNHAAGFHLTSAQEIWHAYTSDYYRMDAYYRKFHTAFAKLLQSALPTALDDRYKQLAQIVEATYTEGYLERLGENWTKNCAHDLAVCGKIQEVPEQETFYRYKITPLTSRIFVIISDAMRYEVAATLAQELERDIPSEVQLTSCQSMFPSITKFGMAALLPHKELTVTPAGSGLAVLADGQSTDAPNRDAVLKATNPKSIALKAADIIAMKRSERSAKVRGMNVVYIYHDTIDAASHTDDKKVFPACEEAIAELKNLVRIIVNEFTGTSILLTADHGFLYTAEPLTEDSKAGSGLQKDQVIEQARRYVITTPDAEPDHLLPVNFMKGAAPYKAFAPREQIRLKIKGSGLNFVHGGASLQEMVVPVIDFRHVRSDSAAYKKHAEQYAMKPVSVRLLSSGHKVSNMSFSLNFYQVEAVGTGFIPANFDVYFTDAYGNVVSDIQKIIADKVSQENTERTFRCTFNLKAGDYSRNAEYFLIIQNTDNGEVVQKVSFQIDTAFQKDDFNFME
nr:BREX-1 system phosphatase PglZ type A [Mitsuokella multacida]